MTSVEIIPITPDLLPRLDEVARGPEAATARAMVAQNLDFLARTGAPPAWGAWLALDPASRDAVGGCAFKGAPDADGCVEIAYFTFPAFGRRGWATAMAAALVARASASGDVRAVIAHTLPERNASARLLERLGFAHEGEVEDPEDGTVWRWRREL